VQFQKITIIGVGLLGGSIGLAAKKRGSSRAKSRVCPPRIQLEGLRKGRRGGFCHDRSCSPPFPILI
jgi:hypothetical protein